MTAARPQLQQSGLGAIAFVSMALLGSLGMIAVPFSNMAAYSAENLCSIPALQRVEAYTVQSNDTLESIAAAYNLLPITLLAMNPAVADRGLTAGMTLRIPPFNGQAVAVATGQTWQDLAAAYGLRADVLFEVNGCPETMPTQIFVPGVSWLLDGAASEGTAADSTTRAPLSTYPLAEPGEIVANYGWQIDQERDELVFSSGITLEVALDTAVVAAGSGTVAYVGENEALGTLIVINHAEGFQTRYAQITEPNVQTGDRVQAGQTVAITAPNPDIPVDADATSLLYFEVRTNSTLGWVARDPGDYLPELAVR
ncbi:MAG: M23 family metallopeptidase [Cyanobacteria bacterium P01_H01_bin.153]